MSFIPVSYWSGIRTSMPFRLDQEVPSLYSQQHPASAPACAFHEIATSRRGHRKISVPNGLIFGTYLIGAISTADIDKRADKSLCGSVNSNFPPQATSKQPSQGISWRLDRAITRLRMLFVKLIVRDFVHSKLSDQLGRGRPSFCTKRKPSSADQPPPSCPRESMPRRPHEKNKSKRNTVLDKGRFHT